MLFFYISLLAAVIDAENSCKTGRRLCSFKHSRPSQNLATLHLRQGKRRERIFCDTVLQALYYSHPLFRFNSVTSAVFEIKRFDLQSAEAKLLKQGLADTLEFGRWRCIPLSALTTASRSPALSSTPPPSLVSLSQQPLSDRFEEEMVIFRHNAGPAVDNAFIDLDPISSTELIKTVVIVYARILA